MITQDITDIIDSGDQFIKEFHKDKNGNYLSWEHCYSAFSKYNRKKGSELIHIDIDLLCLHLASYLASWGMYRGSSMLPKKDYKVHATAIEELIKPDYINLWELQCEELINDKLENLFNLRDKLDEIYRVSDVTPTDTLITKIMIGTLGCAPAFDRYFKDGVRGKKNAHLVFNRKNMQVLSKYYVDNSSRFEELSKSVPTGELKYPQMKILDMCFFYQGYKINE